MPYPNEHAARIRDPGSFEENSFRSKELKNGIRIIVAKLKGGTSMVIQAYRFSVDNFTIEQAKKWLENNKIHYIKFEPAQVETDSGGSMNDNLKHAGIKGMQWGVRKKRDMPGETGGKKPKTEANESARLKKNMPGETGGKQPRKMSADAKEVAGLKAKRAGELSNEELQKIAKRMELEKRYKDLNPTKVAKGKKKIEGVFSGVAKTAGIIGSVTVLAVTGKKVLEYAVARKAALVAAKAVLGG